MGFFDNMADRGLLFPPSCVMTKSRVRSIANAKSIVLALFWQVQAGPGWTMPRSSLPQPLIRPLESGRTSEFAAARNLHRARAESLLTIR